ncbi:Site-2 protease family protein [uncultured Gammaproteobacteria bacterium]
MTAEQFLFQVSVLALPTVLAITLHEAAHGFAAWRLGDDTAWRAGRVSFNPLRHVDPFGTVILPAILYFTTHFLFGWAKPVPVNFSRLNHPRRDMVLVALAGPGINFALAIGSALLLGWVDLLPAVARDWAAQNLENSVIINVLLAAFNLLPLPPLDGGRVAVGLLPLVLARQLARMERFGIVLLMAVLFLLPYVGARLGLRLDLIGWLLDGPVTYLFNRIMVLAG